MRYHRICNSWRITRAVEAPRRQLVATRPMVMVTDARQTGKTSLRRHLFPDHRIVSLDLPSEAEQAEEDTQAFMVCRARARPLRSRSSDDARCDARLPS